MQTPNAESTQARENPTTIALNGRYNSRGGGQQDKQRQLCRVRLPSCACACVCRSGGRCFDVAMWSVAAPSPPQIRSSTALFVIWSWRRGGVFVVGCRELAFLQLFFLQTDWGAWTWCRNGRWICRTGFPGCASDGVASGKIEARLGFCLLSAVSGGLGASGEGDQCSEPVAGRGGWQQGKWVAHGPLSCTSPSIPPALVPLPTNSIPPSPSQHHSHPRKPSPDKATATARHRAVPPAPPAPGFCRPLPPSFLVSSLCILASRMPASSRVDPRDFTQNNPKTEQAQARAIGDVASREVPCWRPGP